MARLLVEHLTKEYKSKVRALEDFDLEVRGGECLGIIGPNGCGKSTFLRIVAGIERPSSGRIIFEGFKTERPLTPMMFETSTLFPWRTVKGNVKLPPEIKELETEAMQNVTKRAMTHARIGKMEDLYPQTLSGGMKRRAELARLLASEEKIFLMDEPFKSLDAQARLLMQEEFLNFLQRGDLTVIFVTHDINEAVLLCDRVAIMTFSPGRVKYIVDVGLSKPRSLEMISDPRFSDVVRKVWGVLKEESMKAFQ